MDIHQAPCVQEVLLRATSTHNRPIRAGKSAGRTPAVSMMRAVAPIMTSANLQAARGVSLRLMRSRPGRIIWAFMTSMGVSSFMLPAKRKSKASKTYKLHRAEERMIWLRVKGWRWVCWMLSVAFMMCSFMLMSAEIFLVFCK